MAGFTYTYRQVFSHFLRKEKWIYIYIYICIYSITGPTFKVNSTSQTQGDGKSALFRVIIRKEPNLT